MLHLPMYIIHIVTCTSMNNIHNVTCTSMLLVPVVCILYIYIHIYLHVHVYISRTWSVILLYVLVEHH